MATAKIASSGGDDGDGVAVGRVNIGGAVAAQAAGGAGVERGEGHGAGWRWGLTAASTARGGSWRWRPAEAAAWKCDCFVSRREE